MCPVQFVMKDIRLSSSKKKEREAAVQEASLLSQLNHPNIVSYRESFQDHNGTKAGDGGGGGGGGGANLVWWC